MRQWDLAQVNIGRLRAPLDDPMIAGFVGALDRINALADGSPGFVWRLQSDEGNATSYAVTDDPLVIVNLSTWASVEDLRRFAYRSAHVDVLRRKREWFERWPGAYLALWWVPSGTQPTIAEALERLALLDADGPTPKAFTFARVFDPDGSAAPS